MRMWVFLFVCDVAMTLPAREVNWPSCVWCTGVFFVDWSFATLAPKVWRPPPPPEPRRLSTLCRCRCNIYILLHHIINVIKRYVHLSKWINPIYSLSLLARPTRLFSAYMPVCQKRAAQSQSERERERERPVLDVDLWAMSVGDLCDFDELWCGPVPWCVWRFSFRWRSCVLAVIYGGVYYVYNTHADKINNTLHLVLYIVALW